ncbi:hypothetical protein [Stackebrandtia soli]|uniref:hypothetical protein n=1 Tax=Stackebrandtia soli TaxID=1892856 RepID=UPI0039E7E033
MQPNPPQPGPPQEGQPPMTGGPVPWGGGPSPLAALRPRANAAAAVIASILALLTVGMFVWFALYNVVHATGPTDLGSNLLLENVLGGAIGAGALLVAAGFTFTRRVAGAWTLCALCVVYVVATTFMAPLLRGTAVDAQLKWIFGFDKANGVAVGLAMILSVLTATVAAIAASVKSYEPTIPRPPLP